MAGTLGPEWDEAIEKYWAAYSVRLDWRRRMKMVEEYGLVRPLPKSLEVK